LLLKLFFYYKIRQLRKYFSAMIKYILIVINSLTVFLYSLFGGDGPVTITNTIPKNIAQGEEVAVEIKIVKGSMTGFAKFQLELPEGISVKEIDSKGANFDFGDGTAKWVWGNLPSDDEIIIKLSLIAGNTAEGLKTIDGKYFYVENNAKQVIEMASVEIAVGNERSPANVSSSNTSTTNAEPAINTATESVASQSTTSNPNKEPIANIDVVRTIEKNSDNEYTINLKIKKDATKGFARYSDDLPENLIAKSLTTDGSSFSATDGKIKFVWVNVPEKEELNVSYTISGSNTSLTLNGEYSFLEENQSKKHILKSEVITFGDKAVAVTTPTVQTEENVTNKTKVSENTVDEKQTSQTTTQESKANVTTETITKTEGYVNYMIQIGAFKNSAIKATTLARKYNVIETIKSEMQGGFSKFMIGNYAEYKSARNKREVAINNNSIKDAFVVAYNGAKRITVQEALMITNQKWYK
jgi:hypothetical protein